MPRESAAIYHRQIDSAVAAALTDAGIKFEQVQGSLYITIAPDQVDRYIALAQQFVRPGAWNEVVGTRWVFIFADGVWQWDSLEAEQRILAHYRQITGGEAPVPSLVLLPPKNLSLPVAWKVYLTT